MRKNGEMKNRIIAGIVDAAVTGAIAIVLMYAAAQTFGKTAASFAIMIPIVYFLYLMATDMKTYVFTKLKTVQCTAKWKYRLS